MLYKRVVIQENEVFAARRFRTAVAGGNETGVCLVSQINNARYLRNSFSGLIRRAIIHNNDFKTLRFLMFLKRSQASLRKMKLIEHRNND